MLLEDIVDVSIRYFATIFCKRLLHVFLRDLARIINVKLVENGLQSLFCHVLRNVNRCSNKLAIVNSFVLGEVKLPDNVIDFFLPKVHLRILDYLLELLDFKEATVIRIDLFEFLLERLYLVCLEMLNKDVNSCFLKE